MSNTESFEYALWKAIDDCKIDENADTITGSYIKSLSNQDRVVAAHIREIRDTAQQEYDRGYHDGQHSMDAEHRAVAMRLRQLQLDGGKQGSLIEIAHAVYPEYRYAWTHGAALRDELVRLMGGVSDDTAEPMTTDELIEYINQDTRRLKADRAMEVSDDTCACAGGGACDADCGRDSGEQEVSGDGADGDTLGPDARGHAVGRDFHELGVSDGRVADDCGADTGCGDCGGDLHLAGLIYDVLGNERRKAIAKLRKCDGGYTLEWDNIYEIFDALGVDYVGMAMAEVYENVRDRLIHLLGGDQPSGIDVLRAMDAESDTNGTSPNDDGTSSITDELRKWASDRHCKGVSHTDALNIGLIADRIDEQFDRICQQHEAVLQSTIDNMCEEQDRLQERLRTAELGCDANHRLAEANARWCDELVDLLRDARDEYVRLRTENQIMLEDMRRRQVKLDESEHDRDDAKAMSTAIGEMLVKECNENAELQRKLDEVQRDYDKLGKEYERTINQTLHRAYESMELPKDMDGTCVEVGDTVRINDREYGVYAVSHNHVWLNAFDDQLYQLVGYPAERCNVIKRVGNHSG